MSMGRSILLVCLVCVDILLFYPFLSFPFLLIPSYRIGLADKRTIVSLPGLIAETNMAPEQMAKLRHEVVKITHWLSRHEARYFTTDYENASQEYIEKARGD